MARINVEASAALARWIDVMRTDWERYLSLTWAARRLPMTRKRVQRDQSAISLLGLSIPDFAATLTPRAQEEWGRRARFCKPTHPRTFHKLEIRKVLAKPRVP
jgi:hypothetical protein